MSQLTAVLEQNRSLICWITFLLYLLIYLPTVHSFAPPLGTGWGCAPCDQSGCPPVTCEETLQYVDECGCCVLCAKEEGERCGGEGGVGGRCKYGLHCAYRLGSIYGESRMGVCEHKRCQRRSCDYRQRCLVVIRENGGVRKLCKCDHFHCEHKLNPLCGHDGWNYTSVCELQRTECLSGGPIGIRHFNECHAMELAVISPKKTNSIIPPVFDSFTEQPQYGTVTQPPIQCIYEDEWYDPFHILPPAPHSPCNYHVCSDYGHMEQYPVLGCEGNPPETDWEVDVVVHPAEWSEWSHFSVCVGNCVRAGRQNQTRSCTDPPPSTALEAAPSVVRCEGISFRDRLCEPSGCPICRYSSWTPWSECSTTCNEGVRTRYRNVTNIPTVPELCKNNETATCRLLECTNCTTKNSAQFHIVNTENGCFSVYKQAMRLCVGFCGNGCCRGVFVYDPSDVGVWEIRCPSRPPKIVLYYPPIDCVCINCNNRYAINAIPWFMVPPWRIIY